MARTVPPAAPTTSAIAPQASIAPAPGLPDSFKLGYEGFGPIKLGMTLGQASVAAGTAIELLGTSACGEYFAQHTARVVGHYENDTLFGVKDDVIVQIYTVNPTFSTISGISVGASFDDVLATYANARPASGAEAKGSGNPVIRITDAQGRQVIFRFRSADTPVGAISVSVSGDLENYIHGSC